MAELHISDTTTVQETQPQSPDSAGEGRCVLPCPDATQASVVSGRCHAVPAHMVQALQNPFTVSVPPLAEPKVEESVEGSEVDPMSPREREFLSVVLGTLSEALRGGPMECCNVVTRLYYLVNLRYEANGDWENIDFCTCIYILQRQALGMTGGVFDEQKEDFMGNMQTLVDQLREQLGLSGPVSAAGSPVRREKVAESPAQQEAQCLRYLAESIKVICAQSPTENQKYAAIASQCSAARDFLTIVLEKRTPLVQFIDRHYLLLSQTGPVLKKDESVTALLTIIDVRLREIEHSAA